MRPYFYPNVDKSRLFELEYIMEMEKSGHTRGSTVDLTLKDEPYPDTYFTFPVRQIFRNQANTSKISRHAIAVSPLLSSMPETATP